MEVSILKTVKNSLGLGVDDASFDAELIVYINAVLATLNQIGVGPTPGFQIADAAATWDDLLGADLRLNNVQAYVYIQVRLIFDPPQSSFGIDAMEKRAKELETRIYVLREATTWVNPYQPPPAYSCYNIIDGG